MNFLGKNIYHLRTISSQRQSDIALLVGKGQTTIGNWENGVSEPSIKDLLVISNYFGIPVDILLRSDLAEAQKAFGAIGHDDLGSGAASNPFKYETNPVTVGQSMAVEYTEDALSPIRKEIESMREDIAKIKMHLKDL
jgi:transcriptional regulator with XRE-family HTH domain